ncbi:MAG TPA: Mut7-C RNAse domain-containing protein [Vicinamibacterales bacterium]|nr:Mut7-C RNAse domain-containing protein [Vicinamibacterales bacterium]
MVVSVRCYAELNDFLPPSRRQVAFVAECHAGTSAKDLLEGLGVPHTEVDLLLVNGEPVTFDHRLADGDRVVAYPVFEAFDVAAVSRVRPEPLREVRFVLDGHLGRLAAFLRLAGFDALYLRDADDPELAATAAAERRILLTRDQGLLKRREVTHGFYVRGARPARQLREVIDRFDLRRLLRPFTRCMRCNGLLHPVEKHAVASAVPPRSLEAFDQFLQCEGCGRVYWRGSHYERLVRLIADLGE